MKTDGHRRSDNFEDRGSGGGRGGGGGGALRLLGPIYRLFGWKGLVVGGVVAAGAFFLAPDSIKQAMFGQGGAGSSTATSSVCTASKSNAAACDFSRVVLASTEDVWRAQFSEGTLPRYKRPTPKTYKQPTLVVFTGGVSTGGCGNASSSVGPFYCPADHKLYIDPGFYDVLAKNLKSPGDFAQAYVLAHEVGHHVQNLIGSTSLKVSGESKAEVSVRVELQADCLAGVWGHSARANLKITDEDLDEAMRAAHAIGDDAMGHRDESRFTHGTSKQRKRWFKRGFDSGDPRECDTFAVKKKDL